MNFPGIWKFLTPLLLGFLLPEFGWIPVLLMGIASTYSSRFSVWISLLLWSFSVLTLPQEAPKKSWKTPCEVRVELKGALGSSSNPTYEAEVLQGNLRPGMRLWLKPPKSANLQLQDGEHWWIRGWAEWPQAPRNPNQFSEVQYLKSKKLEALVRVNRFGMVCHRDAPLPSPDSIPLSRVWAMAIQAHCQTPETGFLVRALLLGDKSGLTKPMKEWFRKTGLSHLLAVSGLHVGILFAGLNLFLLLIPGKRIWVLGLKALLLSLALVAYAALTGFSPSVLRASLMLGLAQWFMVFRRKPKGTHNLGLAVFLLLALQPNLVSNAGFQLSVLAVGGILVLEPLFRTYKPLWVPNWLWAALSVSLSAQISTAPLMLSWTGQFPTWFLLTNLLAIPITTLFFYLALVWFLGILAFGSHPIFDVVFSELGRFYLKGIAWMGAWPHSEIALFEPEGVNLALGYGLVLSVVWKVASRSRWPYLWISLLLFSGWAWQQYSTGLPLHLVVQTKQNPPAVFLWNTHRVGEAKALLEEQLPLKIQCLGKTVIATGQAVDLALFQEADVLIWLGKVPPPPIWEQQLPQSVKKYGAYGFLNRGWIELRDSTDAVLY